MKVMTRIATATALSAAFVVFAIFVPIYGASVSVLQCGSSSTTGFSSAGGTAWLAIMRCYHQKPPPFLQVETHVSMSCVMFAILHGEPMGNIPYGMQYGVGFTLLPNVSVRGGTGSVTQGPWAYHFGCIGEP
jgi:hypothetical protein